MPPPVDYKQLHELFAADKKAAAAVRAAPKQHCEELTKACDAAEFARERLRDAAVDALPGLIDEIERLGSQEQDNRQLKDLLRSVYMVANDSDIEPDVACSHIAIALKRFAGG